MKKISKKIPNSGLRVLEILKRLASEPLSADDIIKIIEENEYTENIYARETISKYFNTLRVLGFEIEKINNKFYLRSNMDKISLDLDDIRTLHFLESYTKHLPYLDLNRNLEETFRLIENSMDEKTKKLYDENAGKGIKLKGFSIDNSEKTLLTFERYCKEQLKLKIKYRSRMSSKAEVLKIDPKNLIFRTNKIFLVGYDHFNNEYKELLIDNIEEVQQLPQKSTEKNIAGNVTFKLKNTLAKAYVLRKEEKILEDKNGEITVVNSNEDREKLMHRLLRYRENCEVLYPKAFREEFSNLLNGILAVYE